jgi:hypothetical protein
MQATIILHKRNVADVEYTLADLTRLVGCKRRSAQLWAEAGVIKAEPETDRHGTGTHRRFSRDEAIIACMIAPFAARQVSIGGLKSIAAVLRAELVSNGSMRSVVNRAMSDEQDAIVAFKWPEAA